MYVDTIPENQDSPETLLVLWDMWQPFPETQIGTKCQPGVALGSVHMGLLFTLQMCRALAP